MEPFHFTIYFVFYFKHILPIIVLVSIEVLKKYSVDYLFNQLQRIDTLPHYLLELETPRKSNSKRMLFSAKDLLSCTEYVRFSKTGKVRLINSFLLTPEFFTLQQWARVPIFQSYFSIFGCEWERSLAAYQWPPSRCQDFVLFWQQSMTLGLEEGHERKAVFT